MGDNEGRRQLTATQGCDNNLAATLGEVIINNINLFGRERETGVV